MADSIDITGRAAAVNGAQAAAAANAGFQPVVDNMAEQLKQLFSHFLNEYSLPVTSSNSVAPSPSKTYIEKALELRATETTTLYIDYTHVAEASPQLADAIREHHERVKPHLDAVVQQFMRDHAPDHPEHKAADHLGASVFHAAFYNLPIVSTIRDLKTNRIGELMAISGTVTRTSAVRPELALGAFRCADCRTLVLNVPQQFKYTEPTGCDNPACENRNRWTLDTARSTFQDWQLVRIQENSSEIPAGSMPRSMKIILRHEIVELAKPGDKCIFTGTLIVVPDIMQLAGGTFGSSAGNTGTKIKVNSAGRRTGGDLNAGVSGLKELGVRDLTYSLCFLASSVKTSHSAFGSVSSSRGLDAGEGSGVDSSGNPDEEFTEEEKDRVLQMKSQGRLYTRMVQSIAPNIFGHEEIKRGILLMLFGGVHKKTADGQNLRGDINVCIVGDPSTSKSQFLKYVCTFLPRAVYTSGKASSAAGLTASIARDPETGEFAIEAGALMLADNGICCIDEFDKMDPADQVAIHEAMEQQTISIAKAGIQATLNARTSILAAANPIKGRYDPSRTLKQNVDISAPIMSRFDLFFVVLDEGDQAIDYNIARHIVNVHTGKEAAAQRTEFSLQDLQLYIRYARTIKPEITPEASKVFIENYTSLRANDSTGSSKSAYRITVRQLESMIRLAEARARLDLETKVTANHVKEAARLLKKSIVHVESRDVELHDEEDEESSFFPGTASRENTEMKRDDGDESDGDDDAPGAGGRRARRAAAAVVPDGDEEESKEAPASPGGASARSGGGKKNDAGAPAREVKLSFNEYQRITLLLVKHLRSKESSSTPAMSWSDLAQWYVSSAMSSGELQTEADLERVTKLVQLVIHRLIKVDHILLMVKKSKDKAKRMLKVHPNFSGEEGAAAPVEEIDAEVAAMDAELNRAGAEAVRRKAEGRQDDEDEEEGRGEPESEARRALTAAISASAEAEERENTMEDEARPPVTPVSPLAKPPSRTASKAGTGSGRSARSRK